MGAGQLIQILSTRSGPVGKAYQRDLSDARSVWISVDLSAIATQSSRGWRVHVLLQREAWVLNMKKTRRIYNELGLQLRNKHPKCHVKAK